MDREANLCRNSPLDKAHALTSPSPGRWVHQAEPFGCLTSASRPFLLVPPVPPSSHLTLSCLDSCSSQQPP